MKVIDKIALVLIIIGAINWGLIAIFNFDLVAAIFGDMTVMSRIVYGPVSYTHLRRYRSKHSRSSYRIKLFYRRR